MTGIAERCFACHGIFAEHDGATHPYMLSSAGCWHDYGILLAREYEDPALFQTVHRLTVDAYALQHPGDLADRRAVQSVWVHYAALHLAIDQRRSHRAIPAIMQRLVAGSFPALPDRRPDCYAMTHADVRDGGAGRHEELVKQWAVSTYEAWQCLREPTVALLVKATL